MIGDIPFRIGDSVKYGYDPYPDSHADIGSWAYATEKVVEVRWGGPLGPVPLWVANANKEDWQYRLESGRWIDHDRLHETMFRRKKTMTVQVISVTGMEEKALNRFVDSLESDAQAIIVLNSVGEGMRDRLIRRTIEEEGISPLIRFIHNEGNTEKLAYSVNHALRKAQRARHNAAVWFPDREFEVVFDCSVMDRIGFLDSVFTYQCFLLDYALRAHIAGLTFPLEKDILDSEVTKGTEEWDFIKFGTKWGLNNETAPENFWGEAHLSVYEWNEEMRVK